MCGLFSGLFRSHRALAPRARVLIQQRAGYISDKPPQDKIGAMESALVLTVMTLSVLGPSGWILAHLEEYKSRD